MNETSHIRFKRIVPFALLALVGLALVLVYANRPPAEPVTFRNPLNQGHGSDPWMVYYEGKYYLAATTWSPSSRPGLTMKSATTIQGLIDASPVSIYTDTNTSRCCNFWAPEFFLLDGPDGPRWYFYYSGGPWNCCDGQRMHVLESAGTDPMGPYTYKARLHDMIDGWAIDHTILQLDGSLYLLFSAWLGNNQNIYIAPMSDPSIPTFPFLPAKVADRDDAPGVRLNRCAESDDCLFAWIGVYSRQHRHTNAILHISHK